MSATVLAVLPLQNITDSENFSFCMVPRPSLDVLKLVALVAM